MTCNIVAIKFGWLEIISYSTSIIIDMKNHTETILFTLQYNTGFLKKNYGIILLKIKYQSSLFVCDCSVTVPISLRQVGWHLYKLKQEYILYHNLSP